MSSTNHDDGRHGASGDGLPPAQRTALLVVDMQHDFFPGGPLGVQDAEATVEGIREMMDSERFGHVVATQDWHPRGHVSFASSHEGRDPFDEITLYGHPQTLWPDHCIQGTDGAQLRPELTSTEVVAFVRKGERPDTDSYSAFRNNWNPDGERPSTGLAGYLRDRGVTGVVVAGLAREVCALWTALDARREGFETWFAWDLTRPVDPQSDGDTRRALEDAGAVLVEGNALLRGAA